MEYDESKANPSLPRHKTMLRYDEDRWDFPTVWLPSLLGELQCFEGWNPETQGEAVTGYHTAVKTSDHLSGAIIFIFGWRTDTEFAIHSHAQQLERYLSRAHWVATTNGTLFYNSWVKEFKTEMVEILEN